MTRHWAIALLLAACGGRAELPPVSQLPTCTSGADLAHYDGQRVVVVGIYRRRMVAKKKGQSPTQFYGQVQLELTGKATDHDESAWDAALAIVQLGTDKRPDDEIARLADRKVAVEGRIVLHPPIEETERRIADAGADVVRGRPGRATRVAHDILS